MVFAMINIRDIPEVIQVDFSHNSSYRYDNSTSHLITKNANLTNLNLIPSSVDSSSSTVILPMR